MFSINLISFLLALSPIATLAAPHPHNEITSYTLPGNNTFPEGIGRQPNSPYFYSGSTITGSLYRGNIYTPKMEVFISTPSPCLAGIKIDDQYRLYVAGCTSGSVFVYDVNTRDLLYTFTVSYSGGFLNDLDIADDGTVYISDTYLPYLLYITPDQLAVEETEQELKIYTKLDAVIPYTNKNGGPGISFANGLVVTKDQEFVILGSWEGRALYRISLDDIKEISPIDLGEKTIGNVDGLLLRGKTLYSVNSNFELGLFVDVIEIEYPYLEATPVGTLTSDLLYGPATAAFDGDDLLVTNFQVNLSNIHLPFDIVRVPLYQKA
ncbi:hypothetical protein DFP73DRAFT_582066 [Morchella snyderi]|nr:hypothetical protein DFP73DRAFT_582066 [Morchella snyderi]